MIIESQYIEEYRKKHGRKPRGNSWELWGLGYEVETLKQKLKEQLGVVDVLPQAYLREVFGEINNG